MSEAAPNSAGRTYAAALHPAEPAVPPPPVRIIEALLFAGGQPLTAERAGAVVRGMTVELFRELIDDLGRTYRRQERPYTIHASEAGYVLTLRPRYRTLAERLNGAPREARLSKTTREVLALIAYKQPITRADIDGQRGSDSGAAVRQLVRLGLVAVAPGADAPFVTTPRFLELFGLRSLDELPQTDDWQQL
jgi:segregation and condensation protein B